MDTPDKITAGDLEVCVLTFNRAPLLHQALESLLAQTARGFAVSVYDNASPDGTAETVEELRPRFGGNFRYVRHPKNIGADANFHAALAGASRKYAMFMHDDDLAHPEYVECAVAAINAFGNVAVLASNYSYMRIESGESIAWKNVSRKAFAFESRGDFAAYIFCDGRASYSSAIYRTADLRARNRPNIYGKIGDTPVMIDAAGGGKTVVLADKNLFVYRIHAGQDSKNTSNGPTREEIVNRNRLFREILMNGSPAHRFAYRISYAEWLSRHVKITREADRIQGAPLRRQKASKKEPLLTLSGAPNMDTPDKITAGDLEVCVLTFNRAPLLHQALESLLAQTARGFAVSVYDNASPDGTAETVEELRPRFGGNFRYVRHPKNIGADANFHAALAGASRKYAMFMHDDDLAHPEYVECAVAAINAFGNVAVLASNYSYMRIESGESIAWKNVSRKAFAFESRGDFAAYIFCDGRASYSSAIYRTADLRARNRPNIYGKIGDTPVMIDAAGGGKTVVLADKNLFVYRIHAGQDSKNTSNGPTREEIVNRNRLFREILMNGSPAHRFAYRISYAEWLSRHVKFAGADDRRKREFLASLTAGETAGMMSKAYSVPVAGEFLRGFIRVLRMLRKLVWRPENF